MSDTTSSQAHQTGEDPQTGAAHQTGADLPGGDRSPQVEVVQAVVDRITSWQDGATDDVVRAELEKALSEAGVSVPDGFVDEVVHRVADEDSSHFDVEPLLRG